MTAENTHHGSNGSARIKNRHALIRATIAKRRAWKPRFPAAGVLTADFAEGADGPSYSCPWSPLAPPQPGELYPRSLRQLRSNIQWLGTSVAAPPRQPGETRSPRRARRSIACSAPSASSAFPRPRALDSSPGCAAIFPSVVAEKRRRTIAKSRAWKQDFLLPDFLLQISQGAQMGRGIPAFIPIARSFRTEGRKRPRSRAPRLPPSDIFLPAESSYLSSEPLR